MKIYTNTYDLRQPSEKKFWVPPHSDFKIAIMVKGAMGTEMTFDPNYIELYKNGEKLTQSNSDGIFGYWKIKSEDTGVDEYTVKVYSMWGQEKVVGELSLVQNVTDSTVYDVSEARGELPSEVEGGVSKIKKLTQAEYDSLSTKEENTLYIITE